jgi:hypothetical protein
VVEDHQPNLEKEMIKYMKDNEKENLNNMENNNEKSMDEKVHYEIKFVEYEDGYRLEASGDKEVLKRLGIGPHMVTNLGNKKRTPARGRRARRWREMNRLEGRKEGATRRFRGRNYAWMASGLDQTGHSGPGRRSQRHLYEARCPGPSGKRFNHRWGKAASHPKDKGRSQIWDW